MADFNDYLPVAVITGPTATGKTALAVKLAERFNGEIVSIDSRQVYRKMDIGTGKDLGEYGNIPYHLIDIADPAKEVYNLKRFCVDAFRAIEDITSRGKLPVLCGGTALYLTALLDGYTLPGDELAPREKNTAREHQTGTNPSFVPPFKLKPLIMGVLYPRETVRKRIEIRLDERLKNGMLDEISDLQHNCGVSREQLEFFGLEYREVSLYLNGECSYDEMRTSLLNKIRQFAKRQDIFFRKIEREGHQIYWLKEGKEPDPFKLLDDFLNDRPLPPVTFRLCDHKNPRTVKK